MSTSTLINLEPSKWRKDVLDLSASQATKREAAAAERAASERVKALVAKLRRAMGDALAAKCGNAILTFKTTSDAAASLKLKDGSTIKWADVAHVTVGNRTIKRDDIASIYGGRAGSESIEVTGTP